MINKKWDTLLKDEFQKPYFKKLGVFIKDEYGKKVVYPEYKNIFNALRYTDYDEVKVVILGQDPYHGPKEAHGLSFSVQKGVKRPPSLDNIFKELETDIGIKRTNNDLTDWAKEGVFLLNSIMTVIKDRPLSHAGKGWETFTDNLIKMLNDREKPVVFILWGSYAIAKRALIDQSRHLVLTAPHPSPLSAYRGFFGCRHFSQANAYLQAHGQQPIDWSRIR